MRLLLLVELVILYQYVCERVFSDVRLPQPTERYQIITEVLDFAHRPEF
jgi:hypothetical protein